MKLTTLDEFTAIYIARTGIQPEDLDVDVLKVFASASAERFYNDRQTLHKVDMINVKNYNARFPHDFHKFIEIAYRGPANHLDIPHRRPAYRDEIITWTNNRFEECDIKLTIDCPDCYQPQEKCQCNNDGNDIIIRVDNDYDWLNANVERHYWNMPWYRGAHGLNKPNAGPRLNYRQSTYHPMFTLVRPKRHNFHGLGYHVKNCLNLQSRLLGDYPIEYTLEPPFIRVNAEEGQLLIAYQAVQTDSDGWMLIPDSTPLKEAMFWDVERQMLYKNKDKNPNYFNQFMAAEQLADKYYNQAWQDVNKVSYMEWDTIIKNTLHKLPRRNITGEARRAMADRFDPMVRTRRGY